MSDELTNSSDSPCSESALVATDMPAASNNLAWGEVWTLLVVLAAVGAAGAQFARGHSAGMFLPVLALMICILATGFDSATGRIPNPITYGGILLGLGLNGVAAMAMHLGQEQVARWLGAAGPTQALGGFALCAGAGLTCMILAGMGGGDMKLLAAMGAVLGYSEVVHVLIWVLLIAVPYSVVNLLISGRLNGVLRAVAAQFLQIIYLKQPDPEVAPSKTTIPLAVPLLVGLVVWQVTRWTPLG